MVKPGKGWRHGARISSLGGGNGSYNNAVRMLLREVDMHPHDHRTVLRYLLVGLLVTALIVLFPVSAKSHYELLALLPAL